MVSKRYRKDTVLSQIDISKMTQHNSKHKKYPTQNQLCIQLGENIRNLRHKNHLTQEVLADMVSSTQKYISRMETGYARPSLELCLRIAGVLQVSIDTLLQGVVEAEPAAYHSQEQRLYDDISFAVRRYLENK